jgi:uncharacterized membrane protein YhaH (DUF805 family)
MKEQNESSIQFEQKIQKISARLFQNKLSGKGFAIRLIALLAISFAFSGFVSTFVKTNLNGMIHTDPSALDSMMHFSYLASMVLSTFAVISFIFSVSLSVRRIRDIVPDASIWPYVLGAVVLGFIPVLSYLLYVLLAILPSDYLTQEKREQLVSKFT